MNKIFEQLFSKITPKFEITLSIIIKIVWIISLVLFSLIYKNSNGEGGGIIHLLSRLHVIIIHFPAGVIPLALILFILYKFIKQSSLKHALHLILWFCFLTSIVSITLGLILMLIENIEGNLMNMHLYCGLFVGIFSFLSLLLFIKRKEVLSLFFVLLSTIAVSITGHYGGALIHGETYITDPIASKKKSKTGLVYEDLIKPILESKCTECHSSQKVKGKLRLDTFEFIMAGAKGSDYKNVIPGNSKESELIVRSTLPIDDDDVMPPEPKSKDDLISPEHIEILKLWIDSGAKKDMKIKDLEISPNIEKTIKSLLDDKPSKKTSNESEKNLTIVKSSPYSNKEKNLLSNLLKAASENNFSVKSLSYKDNGLNVNTINSYKTFDDSKLKLLEPLASRIIWLNLANCKITDNGLKNSVSKMKNLERLHLNLTNISDEGVSSIKNFKNLNYLNLYGTNITNEVLKTLETLPKLQKVFVWKTKFNLTEDLSNKYKFKIISAIKLNKSK